MADKYRDKLIQQIKDTGQEIIDRAKSMVHPARDYFHYFSGKQDIH